MQSTIKTALLAATVMAIAGCQHTIQTTSGAQYLSRHDESYTASASVTPDVDADVRAIAAIEPTLDFPARIGLARIGDFGRLIPVPAKEMQIWADVTETIGSGAGEFVPINPLIASMVSDPGGRDTASTVAHIRRGAARQHVDYVMIYETGINSSDRKNGLAVADLSIVGLFVLPSRSLDVKATASGMLIDVRSGYPYATMTSFADEAGVSRVINEASSKKQLGEVATVEAVPGLGKDMEEAMQALMLEASN